MGLSNSRDNPPRLRDIIVVGGGTVGWMAAAALARFTAMGTRVTVIACAVDEPGAVTTLPTHKDFHNLIGLDEHTMLAASGGTMRLGTVFADPAQARGGYTHAFGDFGLEIGGVALYQVWLRARAAGEIIDLNDYNLAAIAGKMGRFARPAADKRTMMDYGYHLDTACYAAFLKAHAMSLGVRCEAGDIVNAARHGENGAIVSLALNDGRTIAGDLFVDCSGVSAVLAKKVLGTDLEDWSALFPCNRAVSFDTPSLADLPSLSAAGTQPPGWHYRLPLQYRTSHSLSFDAAHTNDEAAIDLLQIRAGPQTGEPLFTMRQMGRRQRTWSHNCVALGGAAAAIEHVEASEIDLARAGIMALLALMPDLDSMRAETDEFERIMANEITEHRDLALLHQVIIEDGEPVLSIAGEKRTLPDSLAHRIALFSGKGRLHLRRGPWSPSDWLAVMLGRGIIPASWDALADSIEPTRAQQNFIRLAGLFHQSAETMPRHADYIAHHCPAPSDT
ncbi:MAG: tryptophan 7-halogenase [Sphingomonas sp.]